MKKKIWIIYFLLSANCFSQQVDPNSFFPSEVGNVWEYNTSRGIARYEIVKDSVLMDNSKYIYYAFNTDPVYRIDTAYNVYYIPTDNSLNWLYYKLNAKLGETWIVHKYTDEGEIDTITFYKLAKVTNKYQSTIFNNSTTIMDIRYTPYLQDSIYDSEYPGGYYEYLASGLGIIEEDEADGGPIKILRGCVIKEDTLGTVTAIKDDKELPISFKLYQNYPNPFNPITTIKYSIPVSEKVKLIVYSIIGEKIKILVDKYHSPGIYEASFDANNLSSGIYICQLTAGIYCNNIKMVIVK
jgi:hypothetical protein